MLFPNYHYIYIYHIYHIYIIYTIVIYTIKHTPCLSQAKYQIWGDGKKIHYVSYTWGTTHQSLLTKHTPATQHTSVQLK